MKLEPASPSGNHGVTWVSDSADTRPLKVARPVGQPVKNAFTIDVEDYFQVSAFSSLIPVSQWDSVPHRVQGNIEKLLSTLDNSQTTATFFVLGWIAERYPELVKQIGAQGHEIASHGYAHQKATNQTREEFEHDVGISRKILQDISGQAVIGYRAPSFSIDASNLWAHDSLSQAGYRYSSSIYPMHHDHYGMAEASRFAFCAGSGIIEIPATTVQLAGNNLPAAGGGYFRLLPYAWFKWSIDRINTQENRSTVFYCHPWEIDPHQPRMSNAPPMTRFRHYVNLHKTHGRIRRLLEDFRWDRMDRIYATQIGL